MKELAAQLGVHPNTIYRWRRQGRFDPTRDDLAPPLTCSFRSAVLRLQVSEETLRRLIRSGQVQALRTTTGRVRVLVDSLSAFEGQWRPSRPSLDRQRPPLGPA